MCPLSKIIRIERVTYRKKEVRETLLGSINIQFALDLLYLAYYNRGISNENITARYHAMHYVPTVT
jgi:hypothetical protein